MSRWTWATNICSAQDGHAPSEGNPQFHQQMVYAVAMRPSAISSWRSGGACCGRSGDCSVRARAHRSCRHRTAATSSACASIRTRCARQNAYYSPDKERCCSAISRTADRQQQAGGMVFTCLSHDIVAHETTHALLDGLHRALPGADQPRRAGLPRGVRRHRGAVPALHLARSCCASRSLGRAAI